MKLLMFGKTRTAMRLTQDIASELSFAGHDVSLIAYRSNKIKKILEPILLSEALGVPLGAAMVDRMRRMAPDMVLGVGPYNQLPIRIFEMVAAVANRPPLIAWIGDKFGPEATPIANLFDIVAYTDTGLKALHDRFGFHSASAYVPLAARLGDRRPAEMPRQRIHNLAFVASATPRRRELLARIQEPVALFGPDWRDSAGLEHHKLDARRINQEQLSEIYRHHIGALNICNEFNVINGLNQRHFSPYVEGTPVITDAMLDLDLCFEPGREILVYQSAEELADIQTELRTNPTRVSSITEAGRRRVLDQHTYRNRLNQIADLAGVAH